MPNGAIADPSFLAFPIPCSLPNSSEFSNSIGKMDGYREACLLGDSFDPNGVVRMREDEYDSRSGSDNIDGAVSGDDQDANNEQRRKRKKYHRHTPHQIQELEIFFKECPHPDDKQRSELSRRLGLESKQVKFWFQNRRTQMKTQIERHENAILKHENDKLRAENSVMKDAISNPTCNTCGGPSIPVHLSFEEHQLRIDNARLRDELHRLYTVTNKFLGWPVLPFVNHSSSVSSDSCLELSVGRNGMGNLSNISDPMPMGLNLGNGLFNGDPVMPISKSQMGMPGNDIPIDRTIYVDLALAAMDELVKVAQIDTPLWIRSRDSSGKETLNFDEYSRTFPSSAAMKHTNWTTEATRDTTMVIINSMALIETLMDANRWAEMFPCLIARATTIDVISNGMGGTRNGSLQLMHAELRVLSPLVPVRTLKFLRFCKQHADGLWAVVDVSLGEGADADMFFSCRRLPSGCIVQDMPNGFSKVTWVEHTEYDETVVHQLYRQIISWGIGFGSQRWLATLQRQCDCLAILMSSTEDPAGISPHGRRSMLKLSQRMVDNFCSGICTSTLHKWDKLVVGNISEDVKMMARNSINDPGEPPGIVLSASTSVWMPVTQQRLFAFLQDECLRSEWDILSNGRPMIEMLCISKGQGLDNRVSLLRANPMNANENTMLILQESWTDISGSLVVYAPVDTASVNLVMRGEDSAYVSLLPSGFAILPDGPSNYACTNNDKDGSIMSDINSGYASGCLLTVAFQILVNNLPTAKLTVESVETVNNLISCTIQKIKVALRVL
ncbi:homeobox-leucine zipper protein ANTHOCYANINLESS 2-like isoform X1 [Cucurbita maxima]|uniref:Homeobox-leucine zipper protein ANTHOCYANINLESS 2-like isoform X1 n=2 Tax=Cucurbita maxima TaxID=3661 RepID=A0A6J1HXY2_CUCMA|nr:homeobox-leucine zipper protein ANTHOCYANINLESS 2-like isoform X1 [Cucurbita maxima]